MSGRTLLFADDHHVLYRAGTRRIATPATRHPANPLIAPTQPWEVALAWTSVYRNPQSGRYQLWYQAYTGDRAQERSHRCVVCYAESDDGIHFEKPALDLFSFNDIARTNIVLVGSGGHSLRYANSVVVDPRVSQGDGTLPDPSRRYKMAYFDFEKGDGRERPGLCTAFSPDGIHWTKHSELPLLPAAYGAWGETVPYADEGEDRPWTVPLSMSDGVDALWDPQRAVFALYGKMWIDGPDGGMFWKHAMGRTQSRDFVGWSSPEIVCAPDDDDPPHVEFHTTPVFYYKGVYWCLNQILNRAEGGGVIDIELMLSRDGVGWERPFRAPFFLARSPEPSFDSGSIFTNSTPVILDDEIRFYYGAYSQGATGADDRTHISGVGMVSVPLDRLAGIAPVERLELPTQGGVLEGVGQVTLKPLDLAGCERLLLNADAAEGAVRVEVLDRAGRRIRGFSRQDSVPVRGDALAQSVVWREKSLADLPAGDYMLRLHLERAAVYALRLVGA